MANQDTPVESQADAISFDAEGGEHPILIVAIRRPRFDPNAGNRVVAIHVRGLGEYIAEATADNAVVFEDRRVAAPTPKRPVRQAASRSTWAATASCMLPARNPGATSRAEPRLLANLQPCMRRPLQEFGLGE
jgi:hypothetical protein